MGLNAEPHAFCTLAQSTIFFFLPDPFLLSHHSPLPSSKPLLAPLPLAPRPTVPALAGTGRIQPNKHWLSGNYWRMQDAARLTGQTVEPHISFKFSQSAHIWFVLCAFLSISHVTQTERYSQE